MSMQGCLKENFIMTNTEKIYVNDVYEKISERFNHTRSYTWSWIDDFISKTKLNSTIYDLGCGNGRNMKYDNLKFIGIDNCKNFINICKSKGLNVIDSNIIDVPLESNSADAIICIAVLHQLSNDSNRLKALTEMKRLVKTGGKILLSVWSINQPKKTRRVFNNYGNNIVLWNNYGKIYERYYYIFKLDEIKNLFKKAGLLLIDYKYDCGNEIFTLMKI